MQSRKRMFIYSSARNTKNSKIGLKVKVSQTSIIMGFLRIAKLHMKGFKVGLLWNIIAQRINHVQVKKDDNFFVIVTENMFQTSLLQVCCTCHNLYSKEYNHIIDIIRFWFKQYLDNFNDSSKHSSSKYTPFQRLID